MKKYPLHCNPLNIFLQVIAWSSFFLFSCNNGKINSNPVIKVGDLKISDYEYNRELNRLDPMNEKLVTEWKKEYVENSFLISDAYHKGYDTLHSITAKLETTADFMMVQKYGYLWKKTVSPIVDKFMEVTPEKEAKIKKLFYFDYITIRNADSTIFQHPVQSKEEYNQLKSRSATNKNMYTEYSSMQWPFVPFNNSSEELYKMKQGDILSLPDPKGNVLTILYLDHIEDIEITDAEKRQLSNMLQTIKEKEIDDAKTDEMLLKGKPQLYHEAVKDLISYLRAGNNFYNYKSKPNLITYKMGNKTVIIDYNMCANRLKNSLFKPVVSDSAKLVSELYQYYYDDYLKEEAYKLGLYSSEEFLLDKQNFKNKLLLSHYFKTHFFDSITVDPAQMKEYYSLHLSAFIVKEGIASDIYSFRNKAFAEDFLKGFNEKSQILAKSTADIKGLANYKNEFIMDKSNKNFPLDLLFDLEKLPASTLLNKVVDFQGEYWVIFKRNSLSNYQKSYETVSDEIHQILFAAKFEELRHKRFLELKKKYPLVINKTGVEI